MILPFGSAEPKICETAFIAPNATVIGRVEIGSLSSIWFQSVVRGDVHWIRVGDRCNVQDGTIIHVTTDTWPTILEDDVSVGHSVTLHGCTLRSGCLIGMGSIVMDGAEVGAGALIGAGSLVTPGTKIAPGVLAMGRPCRPTRALTEKESASVLAHAPRYVQLAERYRHQAVNDPK